MDGWLLPNSSDCLVCGRDNPHGMKLRLWVDPQTGTVRTRWTPTNEQTGFTGVVHGGAIAAVADESMVWAATWAGGRFCLCGEMRVRFRSTARVGDSILTEAIVAETRRGIVRTTCSLTDPTGRLIAEASAQYLPLPPSEHDAFVQSLLTAADDSPAVRRLREGLSSPPSSKETP